MAAAIQNTGKTSVAQGQPELEESLWDVILIRQSKEFIQDKIELKQN